MLRRIVDPTVDGPAVTAMTEESSPLLLRHRLRTVLKQARDESGLTQREVADDLGWSASKLIRIEQGDVGVSKTDLKALVEKYGLESRFGELAAWAWASRKQPWAGVEVLTNDSKRYFGFEASASIMRSFEPHLVPGLLQTDEYTRVILSEVYGLKSREIEQHVDVRRTRQGILQAGPESPEAFFILSEAVVRNPVGGVDAMRRQLAHLAEIAARPKIRIQILPLTAGANFGMRGPFVYLEFPAEDDRDVLYLETAAGDRLWLDDPRVIEPYKLGFQALEGIASRPAEVANQIKRYIDDLGR
jgi:transcriptional regulator with XRE-family HTH domain